MTRKELTKTLRERGLDWVGGSPLFALRPKWLPYLQDPTWLDVERWIELVNLLPDEETLARASHDEAVEEAARLVGSVNFEIPGNRIVDDFDFLLRFLREARNTLLRVATEPRAAGVDYFGLDPFVLLNAALALADLSKIKRCPICAKVFLVKRKDQKACAGACSNTARQRKFRENRLRYEQTRTRNRIAKRRREQLKSQRRLDALKTRPR